MKNQLRAFFLQDQIKSFLNGKNLSLPKGEVEQLAKHLNIQLEGKKNQYPDYAAAFSTILEECLHFQLGAHIELEAWTTELRSIGANIQLERVDLDRIVQRVVLVKMLQRTLQLAGLSIYEPYIIEQAVTEMYGSKSPFGALTSKLDTIIKQLTRLTTTEEQQARDQKDQPKPVAKSKSKDHPTKPPNPPT